MTMKPRVSEFELRLMQALWTASPLSASEVHHHVNATNPCAAKTVRTLLERLQKKGLVKRHKVHGVWVFTAAVEQDDYLLRESTSFLKRFFGSDPVPLVAHLVNNQMLTEKDIERLRAILDAEETSRD
jgi:BlaI family penicillinase repressor